MYHTDLLVNGHLAVAWQVILWDRSMSRSFAARTSTTALMVLALIPASAGGEETARYFQGLIAEPRIETTVGDARLDPVVILATPDRVAVPKGELRVEARIDAQTFSALLTFDLPESLVIAAGADARFAAELKQTSGRDWWFRADLPLPRPGPAPEVEHWNRILQTPGIGAIESAGSRPSGEDEALFWSPGRIDGPDGAATVHWRVADGDLNLIAAGEAATHWYIPIRIGLARRIEGKLCDAGRGLTMLAIYGPKNTAYKGPLPSFAPPGRKVEPPFTTTQESPEANVDPAQPEAAALIQQWLSLAEPPENATELAHLRYDEWGRKVGLDATGTLIAPDGPPSDAGERAPVLYAWSIHDTLDSVDHCTLAAYVGQRLAAASTRSCMGRYKRLEPVVIADWVGLSRSDAEQKIMGAGLKISVDSAGEAPSRDEGGRVVGQSPSAGTAVQPGASVQLRAFEEFVPPPVTIGNYLGLPSDEAVGQIQQLGLQADLRPSGDAPSRDKAGLITKQDPPSGSKLAAGSKVLLEFFGQYAPSLAEKANAGDVGAQAQLAENYYLGGGGVARDYAKAHQWALRAAQEGHSGAQFLAGVLCANGLGTQANLAEAASWYGKAAEKGVAPAQNNLGVACRDGLGVPKDLSRAVSLFQQAAEQGNAEAQCNLAFLLRDELGIARDERRAAELFEAAARQQHPLAQHELAECYATGRGVSKSDAQAASWYRTSAEAGDARSMAAMGVLFEQGRGVARDDLEAAKWYSMAINGGERGAAARLGAMYRSGRGVQKDLKKAFSLYEQAAKAGDVESRYVLGYMYFSGEGVGQSHSEALRWWEQAAQDGQADAMYAAGLQYLYERGTRRNYQAATRWFERAAQQGHAHAANEIGRCSEFGWGYQQDAAKAAGWYERAAKEGNADGAANLGRLCESGAGLRKDLARAADWYKIAAQRGSSYARFRLGALYRTGKGVKRDYVEAMRLLKEAAGAGELGAMRELGAMYYEGEGGKKSYESAAAWFHKAATGGDAEAQYLLGRMYDKGKGVPENDQEARRWWSLAAGQGHEEARDELD